jgi:hypothetical protein
MNTSRLCWAVISGVILSGLAAAPSLKADTYEYTYTGNHFTSLQGSTALTTSDYVSGTFTFASPLAGNLANADESASVLSWSMSNQILTIVAANLSTNPSYSTPSMFFTTDASGNITDWDFQAWTGGCDASHSCENVASIDLEQYSANDAFDQSLLYSDINTFSSGASNNVAPGTWSEVTQTTPEPGSLLLLFAGASFLTAAGRFRAARVGKT